VIASKALSCDVLVVGWMGFSGLVSTLNAAQQGANVIAIDKQPSDSMWIGGNMPLSGQELHIGSLGLLQPPSALMGQVNSLTGGFYRPDVCNAYVNNAAKALNWLINTAHPTFDSTTNPLTIQPTKAGIGAWGNYKPGGPSDFTKAGGYTLATTLEAAVKAQSNVKVLNSTRAIKLQQDETGRVSGAIVQDSTGRFLISAGATILCTGGYERNKEMLVKYCGPHADEISGLGWGVPTLAGGGNVNTTTAEIGPASGDGSGHKMALEVGADLRSMTYSGSLAPYPVNVSRDGQGIDDLLYLKLSPCEVGIVVNKSGARFADEGPGNSRIYDQILLKSLSIVGYYIIDSAMYNSSSVQPTLQLAQTLGATFYKANDIPTLASAAGINPYLATEVANYNAAIANGTVKQLLVPRAGTATPIQTPPFYCFPFLVSGETSYGGVQINPSGNVIDADGFAIPGLYAAGSVMEGSLTGGGLENSSGDYAGLLASCLIFGCISGQSAAAFAKTVT